MTDRLVILFALISALSIGLLNGCSKQTSTVQNSSNLRDTESSRHLKIEKVEVVTLSDEVPPNPNELVANYNSRNFGSPGWRRVTLEMITDTNLTNTFTVVNLWRKFEDETRTLFLLEEPTGLKGTGYLLREKPASSPEMRVNLFLPAGERRVLEVGKDNLNEGLLGSDFTYNDMRMLLPKEGWQYRLTGRAILIGEPAWVLEAKPTNDLSSPWSEIRFYLARNFQLLLGADFYGSIDGKIPQPSASKQMRVQSFKQDSGVWNRNTDGNVEQAKAVFGFDFERGSILSLKI